MGTSMILGVPGIQVQWYYSTIVLWQIGARICYVMRTPNTHLGLSPKDLTTECELQQGAKTQTH
jgi:hypothetical protein